MKVDVQLYPQFGTMPTFADKKVVVLDVLRATSCIVTALANQAIGVIPVIEPAEVVDLIKSIGAEECITGGERKGFKIEGMELGNSPSEYTEEKVAGKRVILCTSNGTKAIKWAQNAEEVVIGSYLNAQAIIDYISTGSQDLVIVCSGRDLNLAIEDLSCAGYLIELLLAKVSDLELSDSAKIALLASQKANSYGLVKWVKESDHGQYLIQIGMEADIDDCLRLNKYSIVPVYKDGKIAVEDNR
ncbi:MAG TPA: 2-phosphosulfolactate phosphatase [Bacillota bacterium]|jgi:2-phosphosulfolactate phosphatase|nr:2-phosphosulfolactate phosphatase [Bacillota bacterium]HOL09970.1 2-phosphosulfolactate phosphatase [Bacillota bacterium]HPO97969.1 2-phosphosulfolactate phosphatase [Bacillota bacterium]